MLVFNYLYSGRASCSGHYFQHNMNNDEPVHLVDLLLKEQSVFVLDGGTDNRLNFCESCEKRSKMIIVRN